MDNEITAKKYLHKESGILFEDRKGLTDEESPKAYSKEELVLVCGEMLLEMQNELEKSHGKIAELNQNMQNRLYKKLKAWKRRLLKK